MNKHLENTLESRMARYEEAQHQLVHARQEAMDSCHELKHALIEAGMAHCLNVNTSAVRRYLRNK